MYIHTYVYVYTYYRNRLDSIETVYIHTSIYIYHRQHTLYTYRNRLYTYNRQHTSIYIQKPSRMRPPKVSRIIDSFRISFKLSFEFSFDKLVIID